MKHLDIQFKVKRPFNKISVITLQCAEMRYTVDRFESIELLEEQKGEFLLQIKMHIWRKSICIESLAKPRSRFKITLLAITGLIKINQVGTWMRPMKSNLKVLETSYLFLINSYIFFIFQSQHQPQPALPITPLINVLLQKSTILVRFVFSF